MSSCMVFIGLLSSQKSVRDFLTDCTVQICYLSRLSTCVTLARLTPRWQANAARFSNVPESKSDW